MQGTLNYDEFIGMLRKEEALPLRDKLSGFLLGFKKKNLTLAQQRREIGAFTAAIGHDSLNHPAFTVDGTFDKELVREGWEKLVMSKLFDGVFATSGSDETQSNFVLQKKIETYGWIEERHLDLNINYSLSLEVAQAELLGINGFRSPRDKLEILQKVLQILVDLIKEKTDGSSANDCLLPTLILVIIRANPAKFISNVKYIMRYRNPIEIEKGENQYCMTNYMSAVSFIYNMQSKSLTLNDEEKARWPGWNGENIASAIQRSAEPGGDLHKLTNQVTDFFGSFFKDVKEATSEIVKEIKSPNSPGPVGSPKRLFSSDGQSVKMTSVTEEERQKLREERERYELELAIAMSLSETTQDKNLTDIDAFSPSKPVASEDESDEKLVRKEK